MRASPPEPLEAQADINFNSATGSTPTTVTSGPYRREKGSWRECTTVAHGGDPESGCNG